MLEFLAEMELLRRKARLLDARLTRWESRLDDACAIVDGLLAGADAEKDPEARLGALESRVERLARRRTVPAVAPDAMPARSEPHCAPSRVVMPLSEALAIVFARWSVEGEPPRAPVEAGSSVELLADVDGIPSGETVSVVIHPLDSATALVTLDAVSDGDRIRVGWSIPEACAGRAWCFTASYGAAMSTSPSLGVT